MCKSFCSTVNSLRIWRTFTADQLLLHFQGVVLRLFFKCTRDPNRHDAGSLMEFFDTIAITEFKGHSWMQPYMTGDGGAGENMAGRVGGSPAGSPHNQMGGDPNAAPNGEAQ